ncbi:uncharacterized protein LOC129746756 [Uranotaenia lowii]|uniref:uncharacterized protein LOC129746756 n=1 Tax=Uranotaenia lowii TaxID=190385 RepID=UPI00247A6AC5|nr:uncharacterized protein LOC129746756 [Uranotaenia lowii]
MAMLPTPQSTRFSVVWREQNQHRTSSSCRSGFRGIRNGATLKAGSNSFEEFGAIATISTAGGSGTTPATWLPLLMESEDSERTIRSSSLPFRFEHTNTFISTGFEEFSCSFGAGTFA